MSRKPASLIHPMQSAAVKSKPPAVMISILRLDNRRAELAPRSSLSVDRGNEEALVGREIIELGLDEPAGVSRRNASPLAADLHVPGAPTDPADGVEVKGCHGGPVGARGRC